MAGPMARNVSDLIFAAKGMYKIAQTNRDTGYMMRQRVMPIPWKEDVELPKKLKIGYFVEEGSVKVSPLSHALNLTHGVDESGVQESSGDMRR